MDQAYHGDLRSAAQQAVRRTAGCTHQRLGSSRCGPGQVAQPVAHGDQPAERTHVGRGQADQGIGGPQGGGGDVEDEVVRADGDDRAPDLAEPAEQLDLHQLTGVVALLAGRHDQQPVGPDQRRQNTRAPGSGVATTSPSTWPSRTRTQSSVPIAEASLRARRALVVARSRGAAPSREASNGAAKMSKVRAAETG